MDRATLLQSLPGAYPALVTPMLPNGDIDHTGLGENIQKLSMLGLAGVLTLGSTGEQPHLSEFERSLVLEVTRHYLPDDQVLIAGSGLAGTRLTIEETKRAARAGADCAIVVTPSYYQKAMNERALVAHYFAVAESSPIPVLLYSVPGITGITIPPQAVGELAEHPNIVGMKNSSSDMALAVQYRRVTGDDFIILAGSPHAAAVSMLAGLAQGTILAVANVCPEAAVALVRAVRAGNIPEVLSSTQVLNDVAETVGKYGIAGFKSGAEARGYHAGAPRAPLRSLSEPERQDVTAWVRQYIR